MRLRTRVILLYFCIIALVLTCIGVIMPASMQEKNLDSVRTDSLNQLRHIDFALSNLIREVESDVSELLMHEIITDPDDTGFTNFLNASEDTFQYHIGEREKAIIQDLNAFRLTHSYVNSVYLGRESGAFVRSHPRPKPTRYDPRDRPWYQEAKQNPTIIRRTDPYQSVTSPDVNIGIVQALTYPNGTVYGVIGADITLVNLTTYISSVDMGMGEEILLVNETGMILASENQQDLFKNISNITGDQTDYLLNTPEGMIVLPTGYLIFHTSGELGWKYLVRIPFQQLEGEIQDLIIRMLLFVLLALLLMGVITLVIMDRTIINPLSDLTEVTREITRTGDLDQTIGVHYKGEVGELASSFSSMIEKINSEEELRKQAYEELSGYRDHLELLVRERTAQLELMNQDLLAEKNRAEAADQIKSAFLATMSHELRTPLNSIIGFTGIILQGLAGPLNTEQEKQLGMVQGSAKHLLALINDVLDISKIEAGELHIGREPVDVTEAIRSVTSTMQKTAEEKGLSISIEAAPDTGMILGDRRRLEQVLMNLLSNAIKFTEQGRIHAASRREDGNVMISVRDTGIGISESDLKTLFQPFHQIDSGTTRKHEGTGLGLSICKKLVELHNGTMSVTSTPGEGSEFTVRIPSMEGTA